MSEFKLGSISTGTLRTEDLLPAYLFALEGLSQAKGTGFNQELIEIGFAYSQCGVGFGPISEWPIDEDEAVEIMERIATTIQELCPPFVYFGAHPGDGADFGFWPDWDALKSHINLREGESLPDDVEIDGVIIHALDDNHITIMDFDRKVLWSTV